MSDWLILNPILPTLLTIGIILILTVFFGWLEIKRKNRRLSLRIATMIIMMVSLSAIILRPSHKSFHSDSIALLTPNFDPKKVDSLLSSNPGLKIMHVPGMKSFKNSISIDSYHRLSEFHEDVNFIFGNGLPTEALDIIKPNSYQFFPSKYPDGIIQLVLPETIHPNRANKLEGVLNNSSSSTIVYLENPSGVEDSVVITERRSQPFQLSFIPRSAGNFLYKLKVKAGEKKYAEILPIHVLPQQQFNILFIQNYPTFETQYLKNFLASNHTMLLRYRLSKKTFRYESINHKLQRLDRLTNSSLRLFDLIIIDSDALKALSSAEIKELHNAIKKGLGMILLFNDQPKHTPLTKSFLPMDFKIFPVDTAKIILLGTKKTVTTWPVMVETDRFIHSVSKNENRVFSGYCYEGFGKVGFQLLQETYRFVLAGDSILYSSLWSGLIEQTARTATRKFTISIKNKLPIFQDDPIGVEIISSGQRPHLVNADIDIPLKEDILVDNVWYGKTWADSPGWHTLTVPIDSTQRYYYVSEPGAWQSLKVANAINQTAIKSRSAIEEKSLKEVTKPISPVIFYLIFLLSAGFLWMIPKL